MSPENFGWAHQNKRNKTKKIGIHEEGEIVQWVQLLNILYGPIEPCQASSLSAEAEIRPKHYWVWHQNIGVGGILYVGNESLSVLGVNSKLVLLLFYLSGSWFFSPISNCLTKGLQNWYFSKVTTFDVHNLTLLWCEVEDALGGKENSSLPVLSGPLSCPSNYHRKGTNTPRCPLEKE